VKPILLFGLLVLVPGQMPAQTAGEIVGRVPDQTSASLPGAMVEARGAAVRMTAVTDATGRYL
jgi:hypothetical protein